MRMATLRFGVDNDFEPGKCNKCPLFNYRKNQCHMQYRNENCPLILDIGTYAMDEEDITD